MPIPTQAELETRCREERRRHALPGLTLAVIADGEVRAAARAGRRRVGRPARLRLTDRFPIGSSTKPVTTTAAALVLPSLADVLARPLGALFPSPTWEPHPGIRDVPLDLVVRHQGGLVGFGRRGETWDRLLALDGSPAGQREQYLRLAFAYPPTCAPGAQFDYTPVGFVALAHLMEREAGRPFEALVAASVFEPLGLASAGFGPAIGPDVPAAHRVRSRPWNPRAQKAKAPEAVAPRPTSLHPSSGAYMSTLDLARFVALHQAGRAGRSPLGDAALFEHLHAPVGKYAPGWIAQDDGEYEIRVHGGWSERYFVDMRFVVEPSVGLVAGINSASGWSAGRRIGLGLLCDLLGEPVPAWADGPDAFQAERPKALTAAPDPPWIFDHE